MPQLTPNAAPEQPPMSAVEEQLRRLGYAANPAGMFTVEPGPMLAGTPDPQSAVAAILAQRQAEFDKALTARQAAATEAPVAPPVVDPGPPQSDTTAKQTSADGDGISPWWLLPVALAAALARRGGGKLARKGAKSVDTAAGEIRKEPTLKHPGRAYGPHQPQGPQQRLPAPSAPAKAPVEAAAEAPLELTDVVARSNMPPEAGLPPPTLEMYDAPPSVPQALVERARGNIRGPVSDRMPTPPTPRPVLPAYTAPLDKAKDLSGNELAKAIRVGGEIARTRAKSAAKTERINKKRPSGPTQYTPDRRVPQEEGERKSFNEVVKAIRDAKNPPKIVKDLKPWLKEMKPAGAGGQPVLPKKKPGPAPKPKYKEVSATAKAVAKRKVDTALKSKRKPRSKSDKGK